MSMPAKRPAPLDAEYRPPKRQATSSPEEGEVDDVNGDEVAVPYASRSPLPVASSSQKFRVPFPFKTKSALPGARDFNIDKNNRDWDRNRYPTIYERSEEDERRFQEEDARQRRRDRDIRGNRRHSSWVTDHYEPRSELYGTTSWAPYYHPKVDEQDSEDHRNRNRDWHERARTPPQPPTVHRDVDERSRTLTPMSRDGSFSVSPTERRDKQKHRLPTPRTSIALTPPGYSNRFDTHFGRDHHYDRDRDSRDQYYRENHDNWDDRAPPSDPYRREYDGNDGRRPYSRSPVYQPDEDSRQPVKDSSQHSPIERSPFDGAKTPERPSSPTAPSVPEDSELLNDQQTVSLNLERPGAPLTARSPPSMTLPAVQMRTSAPSLPKSKPTTPTAKEMSSVVSKKRELVKRSREEEKAAYGRIFIGCSQKDNYDMMTKLGEGTFGEVHKAMHKQTKKLVALKRILMHNEKEGMPITALREIKILKALKHPSIVELLDMFIVSGKGEGQSMSVYMVFPYMDHDLAGLLENERVKLQPSQIKLYMKQLLEGTEYMHHNHIVHRDMKAANLLISNNGTLRIADFGLARSFDPTIVTRAGRYKDGRERKYTNCVVTRWYRPPELLLGVRQYGGEIDLWGIGCVLGEMFMRRPILPGSSDIDQLEKIWAVCGSPNQQNWPNYDKLPGCDGQIRFKPQDRRIRKVYESLGRETCDLLDKLLMIDPRERISATRALDHEYFWSEPLPADPKSLPSYEASHELDQRGRRNVMPDPPKPPANPPRPNLPPPLHNKVFRGQQRQQNYNHRNVSQLLPNGPSAAPSQPPMPTQAPPPMPPPTLPPAHQQRANIPPPAAWSAGRSRNNHNSWGAGPPPHGTDFSARADRRGPHGYASSNPIPSQLPPRPPGLPNRPDVSFQNTSRGPGREFARQQRPQTNRQDSSSIGLHYG